MKPDGLEDDGDILAFLESVFAGLSPSPAGREVPAGDHLPEDFLRAFAEGVVDFAKVREENLHLAQCDDCSAIVERHERAHLAKIRSEQDEIVVFPMEKSREPERVAAKGAIDVEDLEAVAPLLYCRSFQIDLARMQSGVLLLFYADDASELQAVQLLTVPDGKAIVLCRADAMNLAKLRLESWSQLPCKTFELRFQFEGVAWHKRFSLESV